jgi:hypothetical protein
LAIGGAGDLPDRIPGLRWPVLNVVGVGSGYSVLTSNGKIKN